MAPRFKFSKNKKKEDEANVSMTSTDTYTRAAPVNSKPQTMKDISYRHTSGHSNGTGQHQSAQSMVSTTSVIGSGINPWKRYKLLDSPFPRYRHAAASISSERNEIFIMGGLKDGSVFGDTWKIVPNENIIGTIDGYNAQHVEVVNLNNPPARVGHSAVLCGNAFIVFGGDTVDTDFNGFPDNNFYLFNINNNKYTIPSHILNKPNGRYGHSIGAVSLNNTSSRLYLFGGQLENEVYSDLYYFELNTFKSPKAKWEIVEPVNNFKPPPLTNHSMAIDKTTIYVFGGVYNNEKVSNDLWTFEVESNKWTQVPTTGNMPLPVNEHSSCIANDKLFIYGGNDFSGIIYNALYALDLKTMVWSKLSDIGLVNGPGARCGHSMTYLPKFNKIVIMGGDKNDYVSKDPNDFETYEEYAEEIGTMIFELDLKAVRSYLDDSPQNLSKVAARKLAASASTTPVASQPNDMTESKLRHNRNFSSGVEEFRTPNASPERKYENRFSSQENFGADKRFASQEKLYSDDKTYSQDKFVEVDVPSASLLDETYDTSRDNENGVRSNVSKLAENPLHEEDHIPANTDLNNLTKNVNGKSDSRAISSGGREEDLKAKQIVTELTDELHHLKATTKAQMQNATEVINKLQEENRALKEENEKEKSLLNNQLHEQGVLIQELKNAINPENLKINEDSEEGDREINGENTGAPLSNLSKYKIEVLELNNKLLYLEQENMTLNQKIVKFQPFMNNQISDLSNFQKIIKTQEDKISNLSHQVKDQEVLIKEINEWKSKYENLELEFNNHKAMYTEEDISDDTEDKEISDDDYINNAIAEGSGKKSKKLISSHLETLVGLWTKTNEEVESNDKDLSPSENKDEVVQKLQKQVDDLLKISKENESQYAKDLENIKQELDMKVASLRTFESNYRDALQSVNNTSKALKLNQDELNAQKTTIEKLVNENNELKLFKKANKRVSSRNSFMVSGGGDSSPTVKDTQSSINESYDDDDDGLTSAHFGMKIKDLEADIFVLKQERDQLKDTVTSLQKQLYLSLNSN